MDTDSWKSSVLDVVRRIADESYQRTAWFGVGPQVSSPEEIYCELFDDFIYDDFLVSTDVPMTDLQRSLGVRLRDALNQYADSVEYIADPEKVCNDQKWNCVRILAKDFLDAF